MCDRSLSLDLIGIIYSLYRGNTGVGVTTAGIVAFILHKPQSFSLLIIGTFIIFLASISKSIKVD
ncbi:MAG: hypothetical protein OD816_000307 [Thermodesulfobacterium sp.]|uniref:Uncharacterized protein n=1 Tax=Candidatus Thermodesulfobacterium syntrophicum TaxID=3060442 RepID=A0AAE3NZ37_9BACT|nr:hypothetical protein [Candidatus Thermodesulfobacterium syntrophicum]